MPGRGIRGLIGRLKMLYQGTDLEEGRFCGLLEIVRLLESTSGDRMDAEKQA